MKEKWHTSQYAVILDDIVIVRIIVLLSQEKVNKYLASLTPDNELQFSLKIKTSTWFKINKTGMNSFLTWTDIEPITVNAH